jgi:ABC-2 type transport system ATP-binding protein
LDGLGHAAQLAERFEANLERPAGTLSRGNRQKIGLIQALFHEPELLVLDEPTSGLDPLMQEEFLAVLGEHRDRGGTTFLSSHDLDEVERICDRVAIIREGRLAAVEDVAEMRGRSYHRVTIEFAAPVDRAEFAHIPHVSDLQADGRRISFRVTGGLDAVVKQAARHTVLDMELVEPTLEEMFLTYYASDGERAA